MILPLVSKEEAKKIIQDRRKKWEADQATRRAGKQQMTPGQAHAQLSAKKIGGRQAHQDDYCSNVEDAVVCFPQGGQTTDALVAEQQKRERLNKGRIYLDSVSSFNQVFSAKHLTEVKKVGVSL